MKKVAGIKIGVSGIRGLVGITLSAENIVNFARAFATLIRGGKVAIGTDSRPSGDFIKSAVESGLIFSGITPINLGIVSTPTLAIYIKEKKLDGGIIITASHNPEEWNGLKFLNSEGIFLSPFKIQNLVDIYHQRGFILPENNFFHKTIDEQDSFGIHMSKIYGIIDKDMIKKRNFKIVMDTGGGAGSFFSKIFLENLNCQVTMINDKIGKKFPRAPEPIPKNIKGCSKIMKEGQFDIGFAQDPDADRLAIIDENGVVLGGDMTLAVLLSGYLSRKKGSTIVVNQSTSRVVEYVASTQDVKVLKSAVGEINVVEMMKNSGAIAGGEGNGGIIIPEVHYCRDSFTGMGIMLDTMARSKKKVSEITSIMPKYYRIKKKIPFSMSGAQKVISLLKEEYKDADTLDGIRIDKQDYWFHIRPSNTEPVLRIVAEGNTKQIYTIIEDIEKKILSK